MLSGLKFINRDELERSQDEGKERKKSKSSRRDKGKNKKRSSHYSSDEDHERIKSGSRKKKWMDDEPSSCSDGSDDGSESENSVKERSSGKRRREKKRGGSAKKKRRSRGKDSSEEYSSSGDDKSETQRLNDDSRKAMGLDFMLRPKDAVKKAAPAPLDDPLEFKSETEEVKVNPRELNPYFKDNGSGYPEESGGKTDGKQLLPPVIGDGGASWRLKALKRSQEQAAREGRNFDEVVRERWGSVGELAVSAAAHKVAPVHAHLHAIKNRRRGTNEDERTNTNRQNEKDGSYHQSKMKIPKVQESLSWGKSKASAADRSLSAAISTINKFSSDGSFMDKFLDKKKDEHLGDSVDSSNIETREWDSKSKAIDDDSSVKELTANQLAAKVLQLRMKGKHEEAEKLKKEAENMKAKSDAVGEGHKPRIDGTSSRSAMHDFSARQKMKEEDTDLHLAQKIARNQQFKVSGQADDEYDYDGDPRKKSRSKQWGKDNNASEMNKVATFANRMLTQKERCQFCFENPERPKHLVVAIANFTYLSLPRWQPVAPGHCYILTLQHEASTRLVDDNVWDEIRNFKKCLLMMFAKQDKDVIFLETVVGLAQQRRHCLVECIPVPKDVAKQGPLYFKKAIGEAESEWSQHNAKSIIETSQKGLRASIPKNFPYFHVEFGLSRGFLHVIDNEGEFETNFGLNVVRGMLRLPAEDMHSRRKSESFEVQKQSVASFARDWAAFDWTKQLG